MTYNFRDMINKFGFILNGTLIYYTSRSQPLYILIGSRRNGLFLYLIDI